MAQRDDRDLLGGVLFAALGLVMLIWAIPFHVEPDPDLRLPVDMMPKAVAILFVVLGGLLAGRAAIGVVVGSEPEETDRRTQTVRILFVFALTATATLAMNWFPYLAVMPVLGVSLALLFGSHRLTRLVPVAVAPVLIYLFVRYGVERLLP